MTFSHMQMYHMHIGQVILLVDRVSKVLQDNMEGYR